MEKGSLICLLSSVQVGYDMTQLAAKKCFKAAGLKPSDVDVVELHDCFSPNELITYEALGLCAEGKEAAGFFLPALRRAECRSYARAASGITVGSHKGVFLQAILPPYLSAVNINSRV